MKITNLTCVAEDPDDGTVKTYDLALDDDMKLVAVEREAADSQRSENSKARKRRRESAEAEAERDK